MRIRYSVLALTLAAAVPFAAVTASERGTPVVHGRTIRDFARITFEWPRSTLLDTKVEGEQLTVTFDRRANPDLRPVMKELAPYIRKAELLPGGKGVRFTLKQPYRVRSFVSGTVSGVDLMSAPRPATLQAKAAKKEPVKEARRKPAVAPASKLVQVPAPKAADRKVAAAPPLSSLVTLAPAAGEAEAPPLPAPPPEAAPAPQEAAAAPPAPVEEAAPSPTQEAKEEASVVRVFASSAGGGTLLRFPWRERVGMAAFRRGEYLWFVFNKPTPIDMDAVKETMPDFAPSLSAFSTPTASVLRVKLSGAGLAVSRPEGGFEWQVRIVSPAPPLHESLAVDVNTGGPVPPHVFIAAQEAAEPLTVRDPDIGDTLFVVPVYAPGVGISPARRFVEFALAETAQGIAVQAIGDGVAVQPLRNGLRVSAGGALITPNLPASVSAQEASKEEGKGTLFPYAEWKPKYAPHLVDYVQRMTHSIIESRTAEEARQRQLQLAQYYMSEGMAAEALGVLQEIRRVDAQFYVNRKLAAISGAASFLLYRFADAAQYFSAPELSGSRELDYWRDAMGGLLGTESAQPMDFMAFNAPYISQYPPMMRQRLTILAADRAIGAGAPDVAAKILGTLGDMELDPGIGDYMTFLLARISAETGKTKEAMDAWTALASERGNAFVRARAQFALITANIKSRMLTPEEAITQLEKLRLNWRGDSLELSVLTLLGDLYASKKAYPEALRLWRDLTAAFPRTQPAADAEPKMRAAFLDLFGKGGADTLPAFDQVALYYDFKDLIPDDETGARILDSLADRLASLDLLEQAASMLEQRMRYTYEKQARSRIGAKLARMHLQNRQPVKALSALQASVYGDNPEELRGVRDRLAAEAMVEQGRHEQGLSLIATDKSDAADAVRLNSFWKQKDWKKLIALMEAQLKTRQASTTPVTPQEGERLVKLAFAYSAEHEEAQLQYLRDYFLPLMKGVPQEPVFDFITQADIAMTPEQFDAAMEKLENTAAFLKQYRIVQATAQEPETPQVVESLPPPAPAPPPPAPPAAPAEGGH